MPFRSLLNTLSIILVAIALIGCAANQNSSRNNISSSQNAPAAAPTAEPAPTLDAQTPQQNAPSPADTGDANAIRLVIVNGQSEARYRVREQLAGVSLPTDAVGTTRSITGAIVGKPDGTIIPSQSQFVVDLRTLQSDRAQRDNFLRRNVLQADQYPNATFVPNAAQGLDLSLPPSRAMTFKLSGDLTVRNVTKPVTWDITCQPQGEQGNCRATTTFSFEYMGLTPPRVPVVLSVEDHITLEADLVLAKG